MLVETQAGVESEISCPNCRAACCRSGTLIALSTKEAVVASRFMKLNIVVMPEVSSAQIVPMEIQDNDGNVLSDGEYSAFIPAGSGLYELEEDCSSITPDFKCGVYGTSERPNACQLWPQPGDSRCLMARAAIGIKDQLPVRAAEQEARVEVAGH